MALTWNVTKILGHETVTTLRDTDGDPIIVDGSEQWHPVTQTLVFALMGIGVREITEQNVDEVWRRIALAQALGQVITRDPITPADVVRHIGLSTNVSTFTATEFNRRMKAKAKEATDRLLTDRQALVGQERRFPPKGAA